NSQGATKPQPPAPTAAQPSNQNPQAKRPRHKKKVANTDCARAAATTGSPAGSTPGSAASGSPSSTAAANAAVPASAPSNCPPKKTVVTQGGTSEPDIELEGGVVGDQASHERDAANQMLGQTEDNLKKISGQQLKPDQQDMVTQIRQYMNESKDAVASGDL